MALSNELSTEIAVAILAENKTPQELKQLKDVVLQVHTELQKLSKEARAQRLSASQRLANAEAQRKLN